MLILKIQYPKIRESIESDINNIRLVTKNFGVLPKSFDFDKKSYNKKLQNCIFIVWEKKGNTCPSRTNATIIFHSFTKNRNMFLNSLLNVLRKKIIQDFSKVKKKRFFSLLQ